MSQNVFWGLKSGLMAEITYVQLIGILNLLADAKENKI